MSLPVEVPILARALAAYGSELLLPPSMPAGLLVSAIFAGATGDPSEVRACFAHAVADLGPEDVYLTVKSAIEHGEELVVAMLLAALRTGGYDPYLFRQAYVALEKKMKDIDEHGAAEAERIFRAIYEHDFPLDDSTELAYPIGVLLAQAERFDAAVWFFDESMRRSGRRAATLFNVALCHLHLEDPDVALTVLEEAIELDPSYSPALGLRDQVHAEWGRRDPTP
jgi:tetratricopeptide (TPR) repeat protein